MHSLRGFNSPRRRLEDEAIEWKRAAPRWFILLLVLCTTATAGWFAKGYFTATNAEQHRLEMALMDAPTKYQARLSERVAVVEAQQVALAKSQTALAEQNKALSGAVAELTTQIKVLTALIRETRGTR